jgi:hypothetical protein
VLDIHNYSLLYTPCWPSKSSGCVRVDHTSERERDKKVCQDLFFTILPLPSLKKVCVVSYSLEAFWFCYLVLKSPEKISKNTAKREKKKQKRGKKAIRQHRRGGVCVFFSFVR